MTEWAQELRRLDIPNFEGGITFGCILALTFGLLQPLWINNIFMSLLAFNMLVPADAEFVVNIYLPEMNEVLADVGVSFKMQKELGLRLVAMLMKMFYALMWQEYVLPLPSMYLNLEL